MRRESGREGPAAFGISGLLFSLSILILAVALSRWLTLGTPSRALLVGTLWLGLTLVFEFGVVQGLSPIDPRLAVVPRRLGKRATNQE